jgi:hypothetical protein
MKEAHTHLLLEFGDGTGDGRLGYMQLARCEGEAARACDSKEIA